MLLARSFWWKALVTVIAAVGFVWLLETTMRDSRYVMLPLSLIEPGFDPTAPPAPGARLAFAATAYCKGQVTSSGVAAQRGVTAADPALLPIGSVVQLDFKEDGLRRHLHGAGHRTGGPGARNRSLHVELQRSAPLRTTAGPDDRAATGVESARDDAKLHGPVPAEARRARAAAVAPVPRHAIMSGAVGAPETVPRGQQVTIPAPPTERHPAARTAVRTA